MTHAYLLPIKTAAALSPLLALLLLLPTAVALYRRHGVMTSGRSLSLFAFGHYLVTAVCMTVVPLPGRAVDVCVEYGQMSEPQLVPGNTFGDIWKEAHHNVGLGPLVLHNPAVSGALFNLLLLLPLGVFLRYHFRRGPGATAVAGFALSLSFELTQWTGIWGVYDCPYRLFDVDDLAINTSGAVLGWALTGPVARLLPALDVLDGKALSRVPVPFGRRLVALLVDLVGVSVTGVFFVLAAAWGGYVEDTASLLPVLFAAGLFWFVGLPCATGATPGKRLLRLRLVTEHHGPQVVPRLALRAVLLAGALLPLLSLLFVAALTIAEHPSPLALAASAWPGDLEEAAARTEAYASEVALAGVAAGLGVLLWFMLPRRPAWPGVHERLSGVRNVALPPTRTAATEERDELPEFPVLPVQVAVRRLPVPAPDGAWALPDEAGSAADSGRPGDTVPAKHEVTAVVRAFGGERRGGPYGTGLSEGTGGSFLLKRPAAFVEAPGRWQQYEEREGPSGPGVRQGRHARPRSLTVTIPPTEPGTRPWRRDPAPDEAEPAPVPGPR